MFDHNFLVVLGVAFIGSSVVLGVVFILSSVVSGVVLLLSSGGRLKHRCIFILDGAQLASGAVPTTCGIRPQPLK